MKRLLLPLVALLLAAVAFGQAPVAAFTAGQTAGCAPVAIAFQDASTGGPTAWQWNFGNGSTSTLQNPSTTYFTPGTYTVTLTATNGAGSNTVVRTGYITIYGKPGVAFSANDSTGCAPFGVQFTDASSAAPGTTNAGWEWDFGNGTGASVQNPATTYAAPGNYTVSLKVTNDKGCFASAGKTGYIQLTGGLSLDFNTAGPARCRAPFPVSFTNNSTGPGALSYLWNFGDGGTSTAANPTHTYTAPGSYNVWLAVTSSSGCTDTFRRNGYVNIQNIITAFTAPDSVCRLSPAAFTNASTPAGVSSAWDFGDGTTSTAASPVKIYNTAGTYTVRLLQSFSYCTDSFSRTIRVIPKPAAGFASSQPFRCQPPLTVNFTDASANAVSWEWAFGDGATSTLQNPAHTYTAYGNYAVRLVVTNASGCKDTLLQPGYVNIQRPQISFPAFPQRGCLPYATTFAANVNTLDAVTSYAWNFGDGTTSTASNPSHTYTTQGTYAVTLTITTSTGCTETYALPGAVTVGRVPVIDFTASPNPVCAFAPIAFNGTSNEPGVAWQWAFGDGGTSTVQNPTHTYSDTGSFNVTLVVTNNGCDVTLAKTSFAQVRPPIAGFTFQKDCQDRKRYLFTDTSVANSVYGAVSWAWNFGDGNTSTAQNPVHTYASFGNYTVTLVVTNGTCSHSRSLTLNVFDEVPSFAASTRVACKTATVNFTAASANLGNIAAYDWNFYNGVTSTAQNPQVVYNASGTYNVRLITTDVYGCRDTADGTNYIRINGPTALFTAPVSDGCKGFTAQFANQSFDDGVNPITTWQWVFGDGTSATFTNPAPPQHAYPLPGSYSPKLVLTDAAGCKDSLTYGGLINATDPKALFSSPDTLTCLGSTVSFANNSTAFGATFVWDFGDGTTSTAASPSHVYADTGTYTVKLVLRDYFGCSDSLELPGYVKIRRTVAGFNVSDSIGGCVPFEVRFTNTSQFFTSSAWQLGNGTSTVTNPTQVYNALGSYYIKLTVTGRGGCVDTAVKTINIYDASASTFTYNPLGGCKPLQLNGSVSSPATFDFIWDFGDGAIDTTTSAAITHTYNAFGNFVPKLILSDSGNCLIPVIGTDTVRILGVTAKYGWSGRQFCDSGTVQFLDSTTFNDPVTSYAWTFGDGGFSSLTSPTHAYASPGLYTVQLALQTQAGCRDTLRYNQLIKVVQSPSVYLTGDTVICANEWVAYNGLFNFPDTSVVRWQWTFPNGNGATQQTPSPQQFVTPGSYSIQVVATNTSGCADTATRALLVNPLPVITLPTPLTTQVGTPVLLPAGYSPNVVGYSWSPAATLDCADCPQPSANPKFNTLYTVAATDSNGCVNNGRVQVIVLCGGANVFVPNTFSPNGDGSNDVFYVRGKGLNRVKSLRVFNRWGQVIFERSNFGVNDASAGWDGTYKGGALPPDVYVYQVDVFCDNGDTIKFDGSIALVR